MAYHGHRPDIFRWKRFTKSKTPAATKVQLNNGDIDQWMKRVEMASEFAVAEVFSLQKSHTGTHSQAVALHSTEQLLDHDEAYSEAQSILSDWMNKKLRVELEMDEEEELIGSSNKDSPESRPADQPTTLNYNNFDDMYSHLAQEEESFVVNNFLQDLMEREVMDSGIVEDLWLDSERDRKKRRDPSITMEMRHKQVRENRARRDAEREIQHKVRETRKKAREEAQQLEQEEQRRRMQVARRQEELLQQEMVRLRREMEDKRSLEQLARQMGKERQDKKRAAQNPLIPTPPISNTQKQRDTQRQRKLQEVEAKVHMLNLQCMQRHFSGWYSVLLDRRVRLGKAAALCDWRSQLRAWRAWRALVWAGREQREAERTEEELRLENRRCKVAIESDRRRLMRRCLNDWQVWCRMEGERRELLSQQEETRRKMAALISAAASGKLGAEHLSVQPCTALPEMPSQSESLIHLQDQAASQRVGSDPSPATLSDSTPWADAPPTHAWQVTRRHAALSSDELLRARRGQGVKARSRSTEVQGGLFEHRHSAQRQTIAEQRRLLQQQQEQISLLQEKQSIIELRQEAERAAQPALPTSTGHKETVTGHKERGRGDTEKPSSTVPQAKPHSVSSETSARRAGCKTTTPHPAVQAMEERAWQRAEHRREVEEMKRKREEERLAQQRAAEEQRQREEEEEKRSAMEKRKEDRKRQRERELEKQRRLEWGQQLLLQAGEHYLRTLLLHRGLAPWKRLMDQSHANTQLGMDHHRHTVLRRCLLSWQQAAGESLAEKEACAQQLYEQILLRRGLCSWRRLKDHRSIQEERAERFCRARTLRKVFMAFLDHVTQERLAAWDREQLAQEHSIRHAVRSCFRGWRRLPGMLREEREREVRREQLRRKVAEILPDFRSSPRESAWPAALL